MSLLITLSLLAATAPQQFEFRDEYSLSLPGGVRGEARLSLASKTLRPNEQLELDIRFTNTGAGVRVFNAFFHPKLPAPAAIAIYDHEKHYVAELLHLEVDSKRTPGASDWTFVPTNGYVGALIARRAGVVPGLPQPQRRLPTGKYFLQVIFFNGFMNFTKLPGRDLTLEEIRTFYDTFDRGELFRSNVVEFEIVEGETGT